MESIVWQSAVAILVASTILALVSVEHAVAMSTVGLGVAVSRALMLAKKRRFLRSIYMTGRDVGVMVLAVAITLSSIVLIVEPALLRVVLPSMMFSMLLPGSMIPAFTKTISYSSTMRFKPKAYSELLAAMLVGLVLAGIYLGTIVLGLSAFRMVSDFFTPFST